MHVARCTRMSSTTSAPPRSARWGSDSRRAHRRSCSRRAAPADAGFPVIADVRAGVDGPCVIAHADAILRHAAFVPEVIVRVGPQPASRVVNEWAAASGAHEVVVGPGWADPARVAMEIGG